MHFKVYRDNDSLRLRRVIVELFGEFGECGHHDKRRMFGPILSIKGFKRRLERKKARMLRFAEAIKQS